MRERAIIKGKGQPRQSFTVRSLASRRRLEAPLLAEERSTSLRLGSEARDEPRFDYALSHTPIQSGGQAARPELTPTPLAEGAGSSTASLPVIESCPLALTSPRACPFGGVCQSCPPRVQAKLTISQPGDKYEQEAERVASAVVRMPEPTLPRQVETEEKEEQQLQTRPLAPQAHPWSSARSKRREINEENRSIQVESFSGHDLESGPQLEAQISALRGGGQLLGSATRSFMEARFGCDLSRVRIQTDRRAAETARTLKARAFTVGNTIVFGGKQYAPTTTEGKRLLAHELAHVVQQGGAGKVKLTSKIGHIANGMRPPDSVLQRLKEVVPFDTWAAYGHHVEQGADLLTWQGARFGREDSACFGFRRFRIEKEFVSQHDPLHRCSDGKLAWRIWIRTGRTPEEFR